MWFWIDLVMSFPLDKVVEAAAQDTGGALSFLRLSMTRLAGSSASSS